METVYVIANTSVKVKILKLQADIFVISDLIYYLFIQPNSFLNAYCDISDGRDNNDEKWPSQSSQSSEADRY